MKLCSGELIQIKQSGNTDISDEIRDNNNVEETTAHNKKTCEKRVLAYTKNAVRTAVSWLRF